MELGRGSEKSNIYICAAGSTVGREAPTYAPKVRLMSIRRREWMESSLVTARRAIGGSIDISDSLNLNSRSSIVCM